MNNESLRDVKKFQLTYEKKKLGIVICLQFDIYAVRT